MYTLIANSGIQLFAFTLELDTKQRYKEWFHEWYDTDEGEWRLELVHELATDSLTAYYKKKELYDNGYINGAGVMPDPEVEPDDLRHDGIMPLRIDDDMSADVPGEIFSMTFGDRDCTLDKFEGRWLPLPYFFKRTPRRFKFGPTNWARMKMTRIDDGPEGQRRYEVLMAFDTRTSYEDPGTGEHPCFEDKFENEMNFELCSNEMMLMDFCAPDREWSYVNQHLLHLVWPDITRVGQIRSTRVRRMAYVASYIHLINFLAKNHLLPDVRLYKDIDVETANVDMVIDIGNSRTTALLVEDNRNFNQVRALQLTDMTDTLTYDKDGQPAIRTYDEPFDMRLAFRKVDFGDFGPNDSSQFEFPSLVRLGNEARRLIHRASVLEDRVNSLSTYSSPKRYLWDSHPNKEEWQFMVLPGEDTDHILNVQGVTNLLRSDGSTDPEGHGGLTFHYSRRSLMTLAFLEMLVQATMQINGSTHRSVHTGLGRPETPRRVRRIVVTCPTAMSKTEREALTACARDAVFIFEHATRTPGGADSHPHIEVIPARVSRRDDEPSWYYDEATCAQLVYMFGEVGHKYKGCSSEFFNLYGKVDDGDSEPSLTVASLDIGAGTSDLMISKYVCKRDDLTTLTPDPLFYDSYYFAGDDMLNGLIKNVLLLSESSAFRKELPQLSPMEYRQKIKDFFGPDHNGQTQIDRIMRKDFNIQYLVPLMQHFLQLVSEGAKDTVVRYRDVFEQCEPNPAVISDFAGRMGIDVTRLEWNFSNEAVSQVIAKEFEPLLRKIATIVHSFDCDILLLSGRPASLPPLRDILLKYYAVSPDRLIILNNYYVGDWYPFSNNTGYIANPKTIVAMGGIIAHYASDLSNLNKFVIDLSKLRANLKSTVNFIEASREGQPISYFITPQSSQGELSISRMPAYLNVRQLGLDSYPGRALYSIDFNRFKLADKIRKRAILETGESLTDAKVLSMVAEQIDALKKRMPFSLTIERDPDDKERLSIIAMTDRNGNDLSGNEIEINIQSLGANESYWLDSGAFTF